MRRQAVLIAGLTAALAACGTLRAPRPVPEEAGPLVARSHPATASRTPQPAAAGSATRESVAMRAMPPDRDRALVCLDHPRIDGWERRLRASEATAAMLERSADLLARMRPILEAAGVAPGLAVLPGVESSFRPDAVSTHGARGLWQLKPGTARDFGLVVARGRDDRLHVERSTQAAAAFLAWLHERYGDWSLALAAYRIGPGRVDRALARAGDEATFWDLLDGGHLPTACADYVPRVIALARMADTDGCGGPAGRRAVAGLLRGER